MNKPETIDAYIAAQPEEVRPYLNAVRETIRGAIPEAEERGEAEDGANAGESGRTFEYDAVIRAADRGGAYVVFPWDIREEFGRGRLKVHAEFDGEPYDGSIVNMGVKNTDGSVCYIIGITKAVRQKIGREPGDSVHVKITAV